jgi:uncharacterized protein (DUF433 family)
MSLRLPETERRKFRMLALQRGLTVEEAILQAVDAWVATARPDELPKAAPQPRAIQERPAARGPRRAKHEAVADAAARDSDHASESDPTLALESGGRIPAKSKRPSPRASNPGERATSNRSAPKSNPGGATAPRDGFQDDPATWPQRALQLDWSQCPATASVQTAKGKVWTFRGTPFPLWDLFRNMQLGHSVDQILAHFPELNEEQVVAVIQFAGERMFIPDL